MISARGSPPAFFRAAAASAMARTCSANSPGITRPSRTPRRPSIGFDSCSRSHGGSSRRSFSVPTPRVLGAGPPPPRGRCRSGRNSCSGGSSSRMVTGSPSIASRISSKSRAAAAGARPARPPSPSSDSARISRSTYCLRSPRNMCSVRHRPMPWAPMRRARAASSGVSALARTSSRRTLVGVGHDPVHGLDQVVAVARGASAALEVLDDRRGDRPAPRPRKTSPVVPSMEMTSPSRMTTPPGTVAVLPRCRRRAPRCRRPRSCPCRARRRPRARSCRRGWSGCRRRRPCRRGRRGWSPGGPG